MFDFEWPNPPLTVVILMRAKKEVGWCYCQDKLLFLYSFGTYLNQTFLFVNVHPELFVFF